jgi:hypothetical protein
VTMLKTFMKYLKAIIGDRFGVLDDRYVDDIMIDLGEDIETELANFFEIRFVLIDGKTGQLESRTLFEDFAEAVRESKKETHGEACLVGTLLVERADVIRSAPTLPRMCDSPTPPARTPGPQLYVPDEREIGELANEVMDAFGRVLTKHYPEARGGDLSPERTVGLLIAIEEAAGEWIRNNVLPQAEHGDAA